MRAPVTARWWDAAFAATAVHVGATAAWGYSASPLPVTAAVVLLHGTLAYLFLRRRAPERRGGFWATVAALPSLAIGAVATAGDHDWHPALSVAFLGAALLTCAALFSLGKSFGILPAHRGLVTGGAYAWVRHPAYSAELLMCAALTLAMRPRWVGAVVAFTAVSAAMLRIVAEERTLARDPEYSTYRARVRYRLVPGIW